ncbi:hypothetical protein GUJ93_ZPchr0004g39357 [Zizania palustris]|uniref:Uncharacterized protein n=1 Tax=Zizania palustris TaxID=103762 RepID=A0A8J5VPX3_ZIZPA|nr:hypothetical protein GUJ93_ZPchr0004g39357 [Zizania palustris]
MDGCIPLTLIKRIDQPRAALVPFLVLVLTCAVTRTRQAYYLITDMISSLLLTCEDSLALVLCFMHGSIWI